MDKDSIVCSKPHLGELVLILCDCRAVCADAFTPLWGALALWEARVSVLVSRLDVFSLDGLNDVVDGDILEGFFVPRCL